MNDMDWYYSVGDGKSNGPFSLEQILAAIARGQITQESLVWHESLGDWQRVGTVPILSPDDASSSTPPPVPPPVHKQPSSTSFDQFIDRTRDRIESFGASAFSPASTESTTDTWGTVGSVAGAMSGGLLLVGLCFTPMACCAVPVSIAGIASALFSNNMRLRRIGLIGNSIVFFLSLAIVIWLSFSIAMELSKL